MKIRQGFVSNSSSSSFIIGCKGKPTKKKLLDFLEVGKSSPLYPFAEEMAGFIADNCQSEKDYFGRWGDPDDECEGYKELKEQGLDVYFCSASSDACDTVEQSLYNMNIDNRGKS
jgi:hypothetical protein